jgi:hypothetical protein
MRTLLYILIISVLTISCDNAKSAKTTNVISKDKKNPTYIALNYDIDHNGVVDSFQISGDSEDEIEKLEIWFNKKKFAFSIEEVAFDKFEDKKILNKNLIKNNYFLFIQLTPTRKGLLIRDRGDFAGEAHYLYTYDNGQIIRTWFDQEALIDIIDLNGDNKVEFVTETSQGEPGFKNGYDFVDYTLYKVFSQRQLKFELDTSLSTKYNLDNKPDFGKYLLMKTPVLAKETTESYDKYRLMDFENIPK